VRQRLRMISLAGALDERVNSALKQMHMLRCACSELQGSSFLRELLAVVVVLFNYVNFGARGSQKCCAAPRFSGVDVQSLLQLKETKASRGEFPGFHMLHFALMQLLRKRPGLKPECLIEELATLQQAAKLSLDRLVLDLKELRKDHAFILAELREHQTTYCGVQDRDEAELPPELPPEDESNNLLGKLVGRGLELANHARAWMQGSEVFSQPYHPELGSSAGFEEVRAEDGQAPPPGWLWLWRTSRRWQRCWCEIRTSVLVIYKVEEKVRCSGAIYVTLPSKEIVLEDAPAAKAVPFHIQSSDGTRVRLAGGRQEVDRWVEFLNRQLSLPGAGYLEVCEGTSRSLSSGRGRRYYCCTVGRELHGFLRPCDGIQGTPPECTWPIADMVLRPLAASQSSRAAAAFGFIAESPKAGLSWRFQCRSQAEEIAWMQRLSGVSSEEAEAAAGGKSALLALQDQVEDCLATCNPCAGEECDLEGYLSDCSVDSGSDREDSAGESSAAAKRPRAFLRLVEHRLRDGIGTWQRALANTEADCRGLLRFFGLDPADGEHPGLMASQVLEALSDFVQHVETAWADLDRHARSQAAPRPRRRLQDSRRSISSPNLVPAT